MRDRVSGQSEGSVQLQAGSWAVHPLHFAIGCGPLGTLSLTPLVKSSNTVPKSSPEAGSWPRRLPSTVLESYLHCKFKGYLKLAGQQGTTSDFEAMLTELRAEVRLKAIDTIIARHPGDQVARNIPLTTAGLKRGLQYILDGTLEDDAFALHFDGLKRMEGESKLGDFHYVPVLFHEGRQVKKEQKLLLEVYGLILSGLQGRAPAYGVVWHGRECSATRVKLNPDRRKAEQVLRGLKEVAASGLPPRLLLNDHCPVCEFRQQCTHRRYRRITSRSCGVWGRRRSVAMPARASPR